MKILFILFTYALILSSCSSKVNEGTTQEEESSQEVKTCVGKECAVCELPWGGTLPSGQSIETAYSKEIATCSEDCNDLRVRVTCNEGLLVTQDLKTNKTLSLPQNIFQKCFKQRCDCSQAGTVVEDGSIKKFYKTSSASCEVKCEGRDLRCLSGSLEDVLEPNKKSIPPLYTQTSCAQLPCSECTTPWGVKVAHKATIEAFKTNEVACGATCTSQKITLTCNNGSLAGGDLAVYKYGSCSPKACADCTLGSGDKIAHGANVKTYKERESECSTNCAAQSTNLMCNDGVISGGDGAIFKYASCAPKVCKQCALPCGKNVISGGFSDCFKDTKPEMCGMTCASQKVKLLCVDGVIKDEANASVPESLLGQLKGSYCSESAACSACKLSDGRQVLDGKKVTFFKKASVNCNEQCFSSTNSITLTCSNGVFANQALYMDFKNLKCDSSCTTEGDGVGRVVGDGGGAPNQICQLPWRSGSVTHKTRVVAFSRMAVPKGTKCSAYKAVIECNGYKGLWTGGSTYIYPTCIEEK